MDFPGYFAGASLKPAMRQAVAPASQDFPGYFAGASLKPERRVLVGLRGLDFPGYFAGASLKLGAIRRCMALDGLIDFPGYFAGASLKHVDVPPEHVRPVRLPRLLRRGLIEAATSRPQSPT